MVETALKKKRWSILQCLIMNRIGWLFHTWKQLNFPLKKNRTLADLKGKIQFADGYDYKAMRSS